MAKAGEPHVVSCQVCGSEFITRSLSTKYCEGCKKDAYRKKRVEREKKTGKKGNRGYRDTPEMIKVCLNCTIPERYCNGNCDSLLDAKNITKRMPPMSNAELKKLLDDGLNADQITILLGYSKHTVQDHIREIKRNGG